MIKLPKIQYNNLFFESDFSKLKNIPIDKFSVLVIGGAGTIGSNYIKEILKNKPKKITVVDINENGLTELVRDLRSSNLLDYKPSFTTYPVNLLSDIFDKIFFATKFNVIANFSAHKHVRSEKDVISIEALIRNNIFGAIKLLNLCETRPPDYFFSVSTDKAANPVNIMGASKTIMEKLILAKKTIFRVSTARFANVAFSNGSLLDGFINRIEKNQPLSCPSDIKRFFITPPQSGKICLLATFLGNSGDIFFPKLSKNSDYIFFKDIALDFLKQNNFDPYLANSEDDAKSFDFSKKNLYPIYFFKSNTSGEKLYEEFFTENELINISSYKSLGYIYDNKSEILFDELENDFENLFSKNNLQKNQILKTLSKYIENFNHIEKGLNLDQKM